MRKTFELELVDAMPHEIKTLVWDYGVVRVVRLYQRSPTLHPDDAKEILERGRRAEEVARWALAPLHK